MVSKYLLLFVGLLLLIGVEGLEGQPVSDWVDTWPTGTRGIKPILDTLDEPWDDPCTEGDDNDSIVTLGYEGDTALGIDSCDWSAWPSGPACQCGALYPGGADYHRSTWGVNYDPAYFGYVSDTCDHDNPTWAGGGPPQPRHLYNVPCNYETDTTDPNIQRLKTGCFTMQFAVTHCMDGKLLESMEFDFSNFAGGCFGDSVTIKDVSDPNGDTVEVATFEKDSTGAVIGGTKFLYTFDEDDYIAEAPPCEPRIMKFEICGLWKDGESPAQHECAAVFEVRMFNSDASVCGKIPFIVGGRCPDLLEIEPIDTGDDPSLSSRFYYDER